MPRVRRVRRLKLSRYSKLTNYALLAKTSEKIRSWKSVGEFPQTRLFHIDVKNETIYKGKQLDCNSC